MSSLVLFPLGTVLFPGGILPLRIFETRYTDMVRECMRRQQPFGVVLITNGNEVGQLAEHEPIGTMAHIVDFDMQQLGLLLIRTVGGRRFRVEQQSTDKQQLIHAQVELLDDDPSVPLPQDLNECAGLLKRIIEQIEAQQPELDKRMIAPPYSYADCGWVANRLCEVLPIPASTKYKLMALEDPIARLRLVQHYLQQQKVLS
jgi:uncharacterized protein